tara:strand:- start:592 stop:1119 length:528 start_codon:yes stop_codon:yes gene_type:complete
MTNNSNKIQLWTLLLATTLLVSACKQPGVVKQDVSKSAALQGKNQTVSAKTYAASQTQVHAKAMREKKSGKKTILFGIDNYQVTASDQPWLQALAEHARHNDLSIRIDGYTCELGSAEYNVALGFRRAQAVAAKLKSLGVTEDKLILVSYGKEKPAALSHNESAWRLNRRVEVSY